MRRIMFVLVLAAFACSGGEKSTPAAEQPAAAPEATPAAPEGSPAAPEAAPAAPASVGETITLPSGVKITHRVIGTGRNPSATDRVTVHYHGTFPDGKVFDSSVDRDTPATFPLNRVIDCWTEGVQLIKEGGKAQLICPPQTAYGERGQPPIIPPNATLQFEVELLKVL
jgi:FKBP-type peptidyl-prolyl cis-trans isomerase FkpA